MTRAVYGAGFGSSSRCYANVGGALGVTPGEYKAGGAGKTIRAVVVRCRLGWVAVGATERGVCLVSVGSSPERVRGEVVARFPRAMVRDGDAGFLEWVERVVAEVETAGGGIELPGEIREKAFQRRLCEELAGPICAD